MWNLEGFFLFVCLFGFLFCLREPSNQTSMYFPHSFPWPSWCGKRVFLRALVPLGCPFPFGAIYEAIFCSVIYQTIFSKQNPSQTPVSSLLKVSSQLTIVRKAQVPGLGSRIWAGCLTLLISWCSLIERGGVWLHVPSPRARYAAQCPAPPAEVSAIALCGKWSCL